MSEDFTCIDFLYLHNPYERYFTPDFRVVCIRKECSYFSADGFDYPKKYVFDHVNIPESCTSFPVAVEYMLQHINRRLNSICSGNFKNVGW